MIHQSFGEVLLREPLRGADAADWAECTRSDLDREAAIGLALADQAMHDPKESQPNQGDQRGTLAGRPSRRQGTPGASRWRGT